MLILHYYVYLCQYFYEDLFALHLVTIGPNSNPPGQIWYVYILNGDNSYQKVDSGILAGAIEDAFLLGPLYVATGVGLWLRRPWVIPVGLIPVLLFRRSLCVGKEADTSAMGAKHRPLRPNAGYEAEPD
jgi:hypothetical protein